MYMCIHSCESKHSSKNLNFMKAEILSSVSKSFHIVMANDACWLSSGHKYGHKKRIKSQNIIKK